MSFLAAVATEPSTGTSGALVVLGLILASLALFYFMNRSLRRVPPTFEPPPAQPDDPKPAPPAQ